MSDPLPHGRIVTISSAAGQTGGLRGGADYAASKAAVLRADRARGARGRADRDDGELDCSGPIETPLFRSVNPAGHDGPMLASVPLGRLGAPDEIAAAVRFLVSEAAGYITGSVIDVNGGSRMQ